MFFTELFDWEFKEWGEGYVDTQDSGLPSGIIATKQGRPDMPLVFVYVKNLEVAKEKIIRTGGTIAQDTYPFPGGRRLHFKDPAGNELAVWSEQ